jgi:hypothetical protein
MNRILAGNLQEHSGWTFQDVPTEDISNVVDVQDQDGHLVQDGSLVDGDVQQQDVDTTGDLVYDGSHNSHANGDVQQQDENASRANGDVFNDVVELDGNVFIEEDDAAMTTPNHSNTHKNGSMIVDIHILTARKRRPMEQALLLSTAHPHTTVSSGQRIEQQLLTHQPQLTQQPSQILAFFHQ